MRWVILLRGVNVGGHNILPMAALRGALGDAGFARVQTYIQSGNIVLDGTDDRGAVRDVIAATISNDFGLAPAIFVLSADELHAALAACPWPDADGKFVHFYFTPTPQPCPWQDWAAAGEEMAEGPNLWCLYAPNGVGRSKLAAKLGTILPDATARNLNTIKKLITLSEVS